jgi:hypothetical protein
MRGGRTRCQGLGGSAVQTVVGTYLRIAVSLALIVLALPAAAVAAPGTLPPGNSGANQYTETLPGAGGNEPTRGIGDKGGAGARTPAKVLGQANAAELEALGPEGRAVAQLAAATAPARSGGHAHEGGASGSGSSGVAQVLGQLTGTSGSGGMGLLLPLLIAMAIVAAAAYALGRRRTTAHGHD